jgi:hypothetical protein
MNTLFQKMRNNRQKTEIRQKANARKALDAIMADLDRKIATAKREIESCDVAQRWYKNSAWFKGDSKP